MPKISPIHWKKFGKFLEFIGCTYKRTKGDHLVYERPGLKRPVVFPKDKEIPVFVIRNNLRTLGLGVKEYIEILKRI